VLGKDPALTVWEREPLNAESPPGRLCGHALTPIPIFYVRNHGPVPEIDPAAHRVVVDGLVEAPLELSLGDMRDAFPAHTLVATLQCAGNRRAELLAARDIPGEIPWGPGTIGTARWAGVPLGAVLDAAGVAPEARHVAFEGADEVIEDGRDVGFGGSVPLHAAYGALLASEMNGEPLPPVHGGPLRSIVPGHIGARSVKWLTRIELRADPSPNHFQQDAYRLVPPGGEDPGTGLMLGEFPVNAAICAPEDGAELNGGTVRIEGWAVGAGLRSLARVDVSADGGHTWTEAELGEDLGEAAWRWWAADLELSPGEHELVARAYDTSAATQPEHAGPLWNLKGYMSCAWPRVRVRTGG
jgi:sulfite oxidase